MKWAVSTADVLSKLGVQYACISPGFRNTPLTLSFTQYSDIKCFSQIDERSGGYFALGLAKANNSPVVLICTSGTASANYYPAVIEANQGKTPLIIITADRPPYLINTGANQTIDHHHLYGKYVKLFKDVGLPHMEISHLTKILRSAVMSSLGMDDHGIIRSSQGAVHLNFPFEEPLVSRYDPTDKISNSIHVSLPECKSSMFRENLEPLPAAERPLMVCGRMDDGSIRDCIIQLAESIQAPILADPTSQIRYGITSDKIISSYDLFLRYTDIQPDLVIRFGAKPTSKILCQKLDEWKNISMLVDPHGSFNDDCPKIIQEDISQFCEFHINNSVKVPDRGDWHANIHRMDVAVYKIINKHLSHWFEGSIAATCLDYLDLGDHFFIGNSMPIRDMDMYTANSSKNIRIFVNRGASGIDGIVSSALGMASVSRVNRNLLLIGDLSFYHDMNGLLTGKHYPMDLTILVVNNGGGGIFSFLPTLEIETFHEFWETRHGLNIQKIAELFECNFISVNNIPDLKTALNNSSCQKGISIIDAEMDIEKNVSFHRIIESEIAELLRS